MSKIITFSRNFQKSHPRAGEPTFFVEKIWKGLGYDIESDSTVDLIYNINNSGLTLDLFESLDYGEFLPKHHTIRAGNRFKVGDFFSPRVWSGKPYASKQVIIAPDIEVKKTWDIELDENGIIAINGKYLESWKILAKNDGLSLDDFLLWFDKLPFRGQIICWSNLINY